MSVSIAVIGSANTDFVLSCPALPKCGETVLGHGLETFSGGKGANQAVAAARAGAKVQFIGATGDDAMGRALRTRLRAEGVGLRAAPVIPKQASGMAFILWGEKEKDNTIAVAPGANAQLKPRHIDAALTVLKKSRIWVTQFEIPMETVARLALLAQRYRKPLLVNPAPAQSIPISVMKRIAVLTPNAHEAHTLTGKAKPEVAARELCRMGCEKVVVTLGEEGLLYARTGSAEVKLWRAPKVRVVDTVGAGDCFHAWLAVGIAEGLDMETAMRRGMQAAALSVTRKGAQASMPYRRELP